MEYKVVVVDDFINLVIIENALVNSNGMNAFLKHMTTLNRNERAEFMYKLIEKGVANHFTKQGDAKTYNISATRITDGNEEPVL